MQRSQIVTVAPQPALSAVRGNPFVSATINNYARMGVIFIVIDNADSNPGARVRTAAKRRTGVRRLCVRTILQGDEAQRNNPFAEASGDKPHPPSCKARHPPPPQITTHANFVCAGPGVGRWALTYSRRGLSSPPLEGWRDTGPRATCRVGGWDGVVREYVISHLVSCHSRAGGNRVY